MEFADKGALAAVHSSAVVHQHDVDWQPPAQWPAFSSLSISHHQGVSPIRRAWEK
jgi:hypothetical protein